VDFAWDFVIAGLVLLAATPAVAPALAIGFSLRDCADVGALLRGAQLPVMSLKNRKGGVTRTQTQRPLSRMRSHPRGL
jgi:hypothetical protein